MKTYLNLLFCFSLFACSTNQDAGSGSPELDTTEAGLATGAVIGAGVGALVGATAGEAGAGVVLGSIAGATSGGIIGKTFEDQERRIDQHDERAGINTKKVSSAKSSTSRGSLMDTIWSSGASSDVGNYNRPSGRKGIASKYVSPIGENDLLSSPKSSYTQSDRFVQIKPDRTPPSVPKLTNNTDKSTYSFQDSGVKDNILPPGAKSPVIELQKPKAELPAYAVNNIPTRKPTFENNGIGAYSKNLPSSLKKSNEPISNNTAIESARAKLADARNLKSDIKAEIKKDVSNKAEVLNTKIESKKEQISELPKASNLKEIDQETTKSEVAKVVAPIAKVESSTTCEAGGKDFERAKSASSDSDKVFYLRRVILACPKDTSSKVQLGKVYSKLGLKDEAKKEFNSVLEVDPSNESAQDEMSIMMLDSRKN